MKRQFLIKKTIWKVQHDVCQFIKKPLNILRFKKAYDLKISKSVIYVKKYFYMFFSALKGLIETKNKTNH